MNQNAVNFLSNKRYILFWLSQAVSGLGSSMTSFALILWAYQKTQSATILLITALGASLPLPFVGAGQNVILYRQIPRELQGRVFALRNLLQYFTIPLGTLLGGALADYVLEPMMRRGGHLALALQKIVGSGAGSGMAVMFLCTGVLGCLTSLLWYGSPAIRKLDE